MRKPDEPTKDAVRAMSPEHESMVAMANCVVLHHGSRFMSQVWAGVCRRLHVTYGNQLTPKQARDVRVFLEWYLPPDQ